MEAASGEHSFGEFHCEKEPRRRRKLNGSGDLVCFFFLFLTGGLLIRMLQ